MTCVGLNIFYSGIRYTGKDWVRLKVQHYTLQKYEWVGINIFYSGIRYTGKDWVQLKVQHYPLHENVLTILGVGYDMNVISLSE